MRRRATLTQEEVMPLGVAGTAGGRITGQQRGTPLRLGGSVEHVPPTVSGAANVQHVVNS